jgi:hypothetical protein
MLARKYLNESVSQVTSSPSKTVKIGKLIFNLNLVKIWQEAIYLCNLFCVFALDQY